MAGRYFPTDLVAFVAKTGFITKETWAEFFFTGGSVRWKNRLWESLRDRRYFAPYRNLRVRDIYLLNRMNREVSDFLQGRAVRAPFVSQIEHDEVLARGLLRAMKRGLVAAWTTEAELKSFSRDTFRVESQGQVVKYPDAILVMNGPSTGRKMALEVELTQKTKQRYVQILGAYAAMRGIDGVLFVTDSMAIRRVIDDTAKQVYFPFETVSLGFTGVKDWQSASWSEGALKFSSYSN